MQPVGQPDFPRMSLNTAVSNKNGTRGGYANCRRELFPSCPSSPQNFHIPKISRPAVFTECVGDYAFIESLGSGAFRPGGAVNSPAQSQHAGGSCVAVEHHTWSALCHRSLDHSSPRGLSMLAESILPSAVLMVIVTSNVSLPTPAAYFPFFVFFTSTQLFAESATGAFLPMTLRSI
jgi:hypothetical protein